MLLAFLIYNDGIGTIIRMATIYGHEIGIDTRGDDRARWCSCSSWASRSPSSSAMLAGRFGAKRSILFSLVVYTGISILARFMTTATHFFLLAVLVGMVQGGARR